LETRVQPATFSLRLTVLHPTNLGEKVVHDESAMRHSKFAPPPFKDTSALGNFISEGDMGKCYIVYERNPKADPWCDPPLFIPLLGTAFVYRELCNQTAYGKP
jgi:hypothetical protein